MTGISSIIEPVRAAGLLSRGDVVVVDCRFSLSDSNAARVAYENGHIPGAVFADLERDLSGPPLSDNGRHPLPSTLALIDLFERLGIFDDTMVIVYDEANGIAAARLWWLLNFMGHEQAAVLNGGLPAWISAGYDLVAGVEENLRARYNGQARWDKVVMKEEVSSAALLVDSRAPERYRGEIEPIDPVAGHIPGAINFFHGLNFQDDGRILPPERLREQISALVGDVPAEESVFYCGSGVTACNNLLAMSHAGLGMGRLYAGSWSEWCRDPEKPIVTGP